MQGLSENWPMRGERWALFSVYNKTDVENDAKKLVDMGWHIIASGGTAKALIKAQIPVTDVATLVGGGAILGHRVVTLSRQVHAGLLADVFKTDDLAELVANHIPFIDLVRCDFYPLAEAIADSAATVASVVEKTDIGGPCMVRSGAKGLRIVICRQQDMAGVLEELSKTGNVCQEKRQELRARAEFEVVKYVGDSAVFHGSGRFTYFSGEKVCEFKGENGPQSPATLFARDLAKSDPLALNNFHVIEGSAPSYNNWCDVDRLLQIATHIGAVWIKNWSRTPYIAVGVKHGNACGASANVTTVGACTDVVAGDPRAIFGGLIMTNFVVDKQEAYALACGMPCARAMFDGVVAPGFTSDAVEILSRKNGKCRLMINPALEGGGIVDLDTAPRFRYVRGGFLSEPNYTFVLDFNDPQMKIFGTRRDAFIEQGLALAWAVNCTSNSNTITIVHGLALIGNGVGQQDRVGAAELALKRARDAGHDGKAQNRVIDRINNPATVACSDSFFPFPDAVQVLIDAGIRTIFSTSGSVNDKIIQDLCVDRNVTLYQLPDSVARGFFGH